MRVVALTTGEAGMRAQAEGLAEALGTGFESRTVCLRRPWGVLPGLDRVPALLRFGVDPSPAPPWPDVLISCGRRAALASVALRRACRGHTFTAHIQDPGIAPHRFDLIAPPGHDGLTGRNVIATRGALHHITPAKLAAAGDKWRARLGRPDAAVLLGGPSRTHRFTSGYVDTLAESLGCITGRVVLTPSRRTPSWVVAALRSRLPDAWFWDGNGDNPYLAMLALAKHIVVTEDSVSMVSEAASTGKPIHVAAMEGGSRRFERFHAQMRAEGVTRPFDGRLETWSYEPVDDKDRVAAEILRRLADRGRD